MRRIRRHPKERAGKQRAELFDIKSMKEFREKYPNSVRCVNIFDIEDDTRETNSIRGVNAPSTWVCKQGCGYEGNTIDREQCEVCLRHRND